MEGDGIMDQKRESIWIRVFKLCGVNSHPIKLTKSKREHQKLLLDALHAESMHFGYVPAARRFGSWWVWYHSQDPKEKSLPNGNEEGLTTGSGFGIARSE